MDKMPGDRMPGEAGPDKEGPNSDDVIEGESYGMAMAREKRDWTTYEKESKRYGRSPAKISKTIKQLKTLQTEQE